MADVLGSIANGIGLENLYNTGQTAYNAGSQIYNNLSQPQQSTLKNSVNQYFTPQRGSVLGAQTTSGGNGGSYGSGGGSPAPQQQNTNSALQPTPAFNMPDYNSIIQPAVDALNGAVAPAQSAFAAANAGIDANVQQSKSNALNQQQSALDTANSQQQGLNSQAGTQVNQQRQGASDTVRGLQAQFGGSTSAGSYLGEQAYRGSLQNIGQIHSALDNATQQINNQIGQVKAVTSSTLASIDQQASAAKATAQNQLDQQLQQIRMQQGALQSQKAEMTAQALQNYQSVVAQVNSQNAQFQQNLQLEAQRAQELLTAYGQKVGAARTQLQSVNLGIDPNSGQKLLGSFDKSTGSYFDQNGQPIGNPASGMTNSAGGGAINFGQQQQQSPTGITDPNSISSSNLQRLNGLF